MTDDQGRTPDERLPVPRPPSEPAPVERFSAPESAHARALSPERAASIVRQSASARWVGFLAVAVVILFTIAYYFYEVGLPLGLSTPRLDAEAEAQQVTAIERGYNLYEANCARCHGPDGQGTEGGYIGPVLNDQMKLFAHLSAAYIRNVLTVGGRYVCGNANSLMPVWSNANGGPLNYRQIEDLIAFIRSDASQEYIKRHPELNEPILGPDGKPETFKGWVDSSFKPDAAATAVPACWAGSNGPAPSSSVDPNAPVVTIVASSALHFDTPDVSVKANTPFTLTFDNQDATAPHNVVVNGSDGQPIDIGENPFFTGPAKRSYNYPALEPGTYSFLCQVHPTTMTGTLTVTP